MKILNRDDVQKVIDEIKSSALDPEHAHGLEDALYYAVMERIALGHPDSAYLASMCLKTKEINFARWCA